jgi:hypothetical protein
MPVTRTTSASAEFGTASIAEVLTGTVFAVQTVQLKGVAGKLAPVVAVTAKDVPPVPGEFVRTEAHKFTWAS